MLSAFQSVPLVWFPNTPHVVKCWFIATEMPPGSAGFNSSYSSILVKPIYSIVIHIVPHVVQTACFSRLLVSSSQPASGQCFSIALTCSSQFFAEMLHHGKNPISSTYIASDLLLSPALYNISISTCSYSLVWLNVPVHQIISYLTISTA